MPEAHTRVCLVMRTVGRGSLPRIRASSERGHNEQAVPESLCAPGQRSGCSVEL